MNKALFFIGEAECTYLALAFSPWFWIGVAWFAFMLSLEVWKDLRKADATAVSREDG